MNYRNTITNRKKASEFFTGKDPLALEDLVDEYPEGIHINGVYVGEGANGEYVAFTFTESPQNFSFGGKILLDIVKGWIDVDGISKVNDNLAAEACFLKFVKKKNQKGQQYWDVI